MNTKGRRPSFFKVFIPEISSHQLSIPPSFKKDLEGKASTNESFFLTGPSGNNWKFQLLETDDGHLFIDQGWKDFASDHSLQIGEFITFHYDGGYHLSVKVFDRTMTEKEAAFAAQPKHCRGMKWSEDDERVNNHMEVKMEQDQKKKNANAVDLSGKVFDHTMVDKEGAFDAQPKHSRAMKGSDDEEDDKHDNDHMEVKMEPDKKKKNANAVDCHDNKGKSTSISKRNHVTGKKMGRANAAADSFESKYPFFVVKLPKSALHGNLLRIPAEFTRAYATEPCHVLLMTRPDGKSWPVKLTGANVNKTLTAGWNMFARHHNLEEDDTLAFEMVKHLEFLVHIFKGSGEVI